MSRSRQDSRESATSQPCHAGGHTSQSPPRVWRRSAGCNGGPHPPACANESFSESRETRRNHTRRQLPGDAAAVSGPIRDILSVKKKNTRDRCGGGISHAPRRWHELLLPSPGWLHPGHWSDAHWRRGDAPRCGDALHRHPTASMSWCCCCAPSVTTAGATATLST